MLAVETVLKAWGMRVDFYRDKEFWGRLWIVVVSECGVGWVGMHFNGLGSEGDMGRIRIAVCEMMVVDGRGKRGIQGSYVWCTDGSNQSCKGSVFSTRRGEVVVRVGVL